MAKLREEIIFNLKRFFEVQAVHYQVELAFLYGSWARGFPKAESDIDVAVVFYPEKASEDEAFEAITEIELYLSRELRQEVSVILIWSDFRKPMLYYNAIVLGLPVYIKQVDRYIAWRNQALFQMEDFSLFGIRWQLMIAEKNLADLRNA